MCKRDLNSNEKEELYTISQYVFTFQGNKKAPKGAFKWCRLRDSNSRPADYKSAALPTELNRLYNPMKDYLSEK